MAEGVTIKINAQDNTKGAINSAKSNVQSLGTGISQLKNALVGAFAINALKEFGEMLNNLVKIYGEAERAEIRLVTAAKNNPYIDGTALKGLRDYAKQIQNTTIFEDDLIVQQEALLVSYGRTEEQIKDIIDAAANLASAGIPGIEGLEQAVRILSGTYSGVLGQTGKLLPELRNFTKEQLEHGDAVKYVQDQYKGTAKAMTETILGNRQQLENLYGDINEAQGKILAPFERAINEKMIGPLQETSSWLDENSKKITNVIYGVGRTIEGYATVLVQYVSSAFDAIGIAFAAVLDTARLLLHYIGAGIDFVINKAVEGINMIVKPLGLGEITWRSNIAGEQFQAYKETQDKAVAWYEKIIGIFNGMGKTISDIQNGMEDKYFKDPINDAIISGTINATKTIGAIKDAGKDLKIGEWSGAMAGRGAEQLITAPTELDTMFADMANEFIAQFTRTGIIGIIVELVSNLTIVNQVFNIMKTILSNVFNILQPILNNILMPLLQSLNIIGTTLAILIIPLLKMLRPVLEMTNAGFIFLYNLAIVPLGNAIIFAFKMIHNMVAFIWNAIATAINFLLGWMGVHVKKMKYENLTTGYLTAIKQSDLETTDTEAATAETTTSLNGGNVTVQKQPDIYIYQYFQGPVIGEGGMRQVGEYTVRAIEEYAAYGGRVNWMEAVPA